MKYLKFISTSAVLALALSSPAESARMSIVQGIGTISGEREAYFDPDTGYNGFVIGTGASEDGIDRAVSSFERFDSSLGQLVSVYFSYDFTFGSYLYAGAFSSSRVSGVSATSSHEGIVNFGFDSVFDTQIEYGSNSNNIYAQQATKYSNIPVPWNTSQLWTGYYAADDNMQYPYYWESNLINFDSSLFDDFSNGSFGFEVIAKTFDSSITGCNYLSTCGMTTWTHAMVTNPTLTYVFETSTVPVPAAVWLFGSGLLGLISIAKRKQA